MVKFLGRSQAKELRIIASQANWEKNCRENRIFSSLNGNDNIYLYFCSEHMNLRNRTIICCYQMLHIYSVFLLHLQIAKNKGFLIKIKVFIGFSAKLKVLKDFNKIKGF